MALASKFRMIALTCAAGTALSFSGVALAGGTTETFEVGGSSVSAAMPCDAPTSGPAAEGSQSSMCVMGDLMFVFAASSGPDSSQSEPFASDFDAALEEIQSSDDTDFIEETQEDGRRVMLATRDPASGFGIVKVVQVADDAVVYTIAMSRPNEEQPLSEPDGQMMRDFAASLEINP